MDVGLPVVFVISGDSKARRHLELRLKQVDCDVRLCRSPDDFERNSSPHAAGCILLHFNHAEIDRQWLATLGKQEHHWPVICLAAEADVETAVAAMKQGAFDFLLEASSELCFRQAVEEALRWDSAHRRHIAHVQSARRRWMQLSQPLREVLDLLVKGRSNREIAEELNLSERCIEVRRAKIMQAMKARSLAALVRQALLAEGLGPARSLATVEEEWESDERPLTAR
jgi:two-component system, LuxR family, response regulator FixJ